MTSSIFTKEYDKFRKLLSKYRQECGVTQAKLAEKLNRPQSYISKYESGERRLDVIEFLKIAKILKMDIPKFFKELDSGD
jgi:transcriptional regulator with XRE-family HTH domain